MCQLVLWLVRGHTYVWPIDVTSPHCKLVLFPIKNTRSSIGGTWASVCVYLHLLSFVVQHLLAVVTLAFVSLGAAELLDIWLFLCYLLVRNLQ